jgi:putative hemolysin
VLALINGIFAMSEVALLSSRKVRLQHLAEHGNARARRALHLIEKPNNFLATVQVGVTLVGVLAGAFGGATIAETITQHLSRYARLAPYSETIGISVIVLLITYLSLVLGELVPKRLALHSPEQIAAAVAGPMSLLSRVGAPLVAILSFSTDALLKVFRLRDPTESAVTVDDVRGLIRMGTQTGVFEPGEQRIVERVFQFADRRVSAIMTPRGNIAWLDLNDQHSELRANIVGSRHSRLPVCDGDLDHVVGILEAREFLAECRTIDIRPLLKPPILVPETTPALKTLEQFRQTTVHIALVIDEYGGVVGLVSEKDILEALVGDLPDKMPGEERIRRRADGSFLVDGGLPVEDLKTLLHVNELPGHGSGRFQTVAGFVIDNLRKIPSEADRFEWQGNRFEVVDMDGNRIDKVLVVPGRGRESSAAD